MAVDPQDYARLSDNQLKFLNKYKLNDDQLAIAFAVDKEARRQKVNPDFVWPMVYQESKFDPTAVSRKGAFGVMQLMEDTAKGLKVDRTDMEQNIRGGISLLRELIDNPKIGDDPYKVLAGYNASTETRNKFYASGNLSDLKDETIVHMNKIVGHYGGDLPSATFVQADVPETVSSADASESSDVAPNPYKTSASNSSGEEKPVRGSPAEAGAITGAIGLGVGAIKYPAFAMAKPVVDFFRNKKNLTSEDMSKIAEIVTKQNTAATNAPTTAAKQPIPVGTSDAGRMAPGQTGNMPYNYAKSVGLTDIEAGQALDMTKNKGGAHDLANQRTANLQKVNQIAPGYIENPNFGGLMTSSGSAGGGPRESFSYKPIEIENGKVVNQGGMTPLPKTQPVDATPPPTTPVAAPLQTKKPNVASRVVGAVAGSPPVMGGLAAYGAGYNAQDAYNKAEAKDYVGAAKSTLGAVASGASLIPKAAPVAGTASALIDADRRLQEKDYVGAGTSLLGAVAPYAAPFVFGPQVGIPVGIATAVGAPFVNEIKDYISRKSGKSQPDQPADNRSMRQKLSDANAEERRQLGYR